MFGQPIYGYGSLDDMLFRSTTTKDGEIFFVEDKEISLRELAMNVVIPTDPGQRTVKGDISVICFDIAYRCTSIQISRLQITVGHQTTVL